MFSRLVHRAAFAVAVFAASLPAAAQQYPTVPDHTVIGRIGSGSGSGPSQAIPWTTLFSGLIQPCSSSASGSVPATGGGTTTFLRADCTFAVPPGPSISNNQILANVSGSTASASGTNPASLWDAFCSSSVGQFWVRLSSAWGCISLGYVNPVWWGADPTGSADSATAFNSAITIGLPIRWPTGTFKMNSAQSKMLSTASCFVMTGAGDATILKWPNSSGGITMTKTHTDACFHIRDLVMTTGQSGNSNGLHIVGTGFNIPYPPQSDIQNVIFRGDDYAPNAGLHCWGAAMLIHDWSEIFVKGVNTYGTWGAIGSAGCGTGIYLEGDAATSDYAIHLNIVSSAFNFHAAGIQLNSYWQGVACVLCNFNGESGSNAIVIPGSQAGVLAGLWVTASQFDSGGNQINMGTAVNGGAITGNTFTSSSSSTSGIVVNGGQWAITGNVFNTNANGSTQTGVLVNSSSNGTVVGNIFNGFGTAVTMLSGSSLYTVALNSYAGVTTKISNAGTNNSIGTASAGNMTGVVP